MRKIATLVITAALFGSANVYAQESIHLFNGKDQNNWEIFIGTALKGFDTLNAVATPESVYSIVEIDGQKVLHISGTVNASIATREEFENYDLRLEYKWGEKVNTTRNSGLLYHSYGDFGSVMGTWMNSIECQLMSGNNGNAYSMGLACFDAMFQKRTKTRFIHPMATPCLLATTKLAAK